MKKLLTVLLVLIVNTMIFAAIPPVSQKISYQAVVRNSSNALVNNQVVGMKISILYGSAMGTVVYAETQTPTTNANGLISVSIGSGTVVSGSYSAIEWGSGTHFLKTEIDPAGGTAYTITATSELLSVPHALYAATARTLKLPLTISGSFSATPLTIENSGTDLYTIKGISTNGHGLYGETKGLVTAGVYGKGAGADFSMGVVGMTGEGSYTSIPGNSGVLGLADAKIGVAGTALAGTGGYFSSKTGLALSTKGNIRLTGIGEAAGRILTSDAAGNATWQTPGVDVTLPAGVNGNVQFNNAGVFGGDNNLFWNNSNKRLGIGTNAPAGMVEIKGNSNTEVSQLLLTENDSEYARLSFKNIKNTNKAWTIAGNTNTMDDNSMLNFWYFNGTTGNDIMTINGNGNVGLGVYDPTYKLTLNGGSQSGELHMVTTASGTTRFDGLRIGMSADGLNAWLWSYENGKLYFGTNNLQRMTIMNDGKIGIGDTTPEATLDVEGTVVIGSTGKMFSEIREITGTTSAASGVVIVSYPSGYNKDNIRVLSCEINFSGNSWIGLGGSDTPNNATKVFYYLGPDIWIYYPANEFFQNKAFRMMVMKVQ